MLNQFGYFSVQIAQNFIGISQNARELLKINECVLGFSKICVEFRLKNTQFLPLEVFDYGNKRVGMAPVKAAAAAEPASILI